MYLRELRANCRQLLAAMAGMGLGSALSHYTMGLFAPELIAEFGWTKSQFALIGLTSVVALVFGPLVGRFIDRFGARLSAIIGFAALPFSYIAFAVMNGEFVVFFSIVILQSIFAGLAASAVFLRIVVERLDVARGIGLSLTMMAPPLVGGIAVPLLGEVINDSGWRTGYYVLAIVTALGGAFAISMIGPNERRAEHRAASFKMKRNDIVQLLRSPSLILLFVGMFLVNVPQNFALTQLKLFALSEGLADQSATLMISLYASGVIVGRAISGIALDLMSPQIVALIALGIPTVGYCVLAAGGSTPLILAGAVLSIGLAQGTEGDIGAYILSRLFDMSNFSLLLSLLNVMLGLGASAGALVLSLSLEMHGDYGYFMLVAAGATLVGALCFAMTGGEAVRRAGGSPQDEPG